MMSEQYHEPWRINDKGDFEGADGQLAKEWPLGPMIPEIKRRIVACVNACQGIETETLEALGDGGVTEAHKNATDLADAAKASMEGNARATEAERLLEWALDYAQCDKSKQSRPTDEQMIAKARAFLAGTKPAPDDDWVSADSPPKDGLRVLAWVPPYGPSTAHLENGRWHCHSVLNKDAVPTHWKHARAPDAVTKEGGE